MVDSNERCGECGHTERAHSPMGHLCRAYIDGHECDCSGFRAHGPGDEDPLEAIAEALLNWREIAKKPLEAVRIREQASIGHPLADRQASVEKLQTALSSTLHLLEYSLDCGEVRKVRTYLREAQQITRAIRHANK